MMIIVKQNGINSGVFSDQCRHISQKCVTQGGSTEKFTTNDGSKIMAYENYRM